MINFQGLNNLDTIKQELYIDWKSEHLINFEGLESLKQMGSGYYSNHSIKFANIEDFTGLDSLQIIEGKLEIHNCYDLISLSGLEQISDIYELEIAHTSSFTELGFSHNLDIGIMTLHSLSSLENLDGIEFVDSFFALNLVYLNELVSLDSLYSLSTLSALTINNCFKLQNLNGLNGLTSIQDYYLSIKENNELSDISALNDADFSDVNKITIRDNPKLSTCSINSICEYIEMGGNTTIFDNDIGCNNTNEIEYDCDGFLSIFQGLGSSFSGTPNNYWHNPVNWQNNEIPNEFSLAILPPNHNCIVQSDSTANCKILDLRTAATITCEINSILNILEE